MPTILIVDPHNVDWERYRELLASYDLVFARTQEDVEKQKIFEQIQVPQAAVVLWQDGGARIVAKLKQLLPELGIVAIDETASRDVYSLAMQIGAIECIPKPLDDSICEAVRIALGDTELRPMIDLLREQLIGESPQWNGVLEKVARAIRTNLGTVLITGETGTGKELVARAIHDNGERSRFPFVAVNAAAVQPNLLESELFGHEKGAFTGANEQRIGVFERCGSGTLFLDEIGELAEDLQAKLLRIVQERSFTRLGGNKAVTFHGRLVVATNKNLLEQVEIKAFREDLYYRFNTHTIVLPPLRERRGDWRLLAECFLRKHAPGQNLRLSSAAQIVLSNCEFPGNARQLENAVLYCLSFQPKGLILPSQLPPDLLEHRQALCNADEMIFSAQLLDMPLKTALDLLERSFNMQYLPRILAANRNIVTRAAEQAGITAKTFRDKWKEAGLPPLNER